MYTGLACLEALELLSITATKYLGSAEGITDDIQQVLDSLTDKFTSVYDSDDGEYGEITYHIELLNRLCCTLLMVLISSNKLIQHCTVVSKSLF